MCDHSHHVYKDLSHYEKRRHLWQSASVKLERKNIVNKDLYKIFDIPVKYNTLFCNSSKSLWSIHFCFVAIQNVYPFRHCVCISHLNLLIYFSFLRFDTHRQGSISYETFLSRIGASEFTPGDLLGTSSQIIDQSKQTLDDHNHTQMEKHERITSIQANRAGFMTVEQVEQALK